MSDRLCCTDPNASNYDSLATCDDGSCIIPCNASAITGVFVDQIIHNRAAFNWDNMNTSNCQVDQIVFTEKLDQVVDSEILGNPVGSTIYYGTSKRIINLTPSTTYEYQFKIWYVGVVVQLTGVLIHQERSLHLMSVQT